MKKIFVMAALVVGGIWCDAASAQCGSGGHRVRHCGSASQCAPCQTAQPCIQTCVVYRTVCGGCYQGQATQYLPYTAAPAPVLAPKTIVVPSVSQEPLQTIYPTPNSVNPTPATPNPTPIPNESPLPPKRIQAPDTQPPFLITRTIYMNGQVYGQMGDGVFTYLGCPSCRN